MTDARAASTRHRELLAIARALLSALAGGALFYVIGLPMPWLLGAITGTAIAVMLGLKARLPSALRNLVLIVLGLMIGATLNPAALSHISQWPISLCSVVLYVVAVTAAQYLFFRRVGGYDAPTAYFSAAPGGFMAMTVIGADFGGQERLIALTHAVRIVLVVFVIVLGYHLLLGEGPGGGARHLPLSQVSAIDLGALLVLGALGAVGARLLRLLRLPGGYMLGPLLVAAVMQLSGLMMLSVPSAPILVAEVVLGSSIGAQFAGASLRELGRGFLLSMSSTLLMLLLTIVFSMAVRALTGLPLLALILAFSPGGMSGISLIALALNIEPAFVTVHNMTRVLVILIAGPLLFRSRIGRAE